MLVSALFLFDIDHRSIILALLLCVGLMPRGLVSSERRSTVSLVLLLTALNIAIAIVVNDLVSVHKYQVRRVHLLNTLG